jgi:hypothetical protein
MSAQAEIQLGSVVSAGGTVDTADANARVVAYQSPAPCVRGPRAWRARAKAWNGTREERVRVPSHVPLRAGALSTVPVGTVTAMDCVSNLHAE